MIVDTLFLTNRDDISVEYLISKFRDYSSNYLRINSEDIGLIKFELNPTGNYFCWIDEACYNLNQVKSVLFRRAPSKYIFEKTNPDAPYLNFERRHFFEGMYLSFSNAKWINPMFSTHIAERKLFQLNIADKLGLKVPKSIVTNNLDKARQFLLNNKKSIIKPISNGLQVTEGATYSIYTSHIEPDFFTGFNSNMIFETPIFLQERVENNGDIRVTIIGDKVFSVKIDKINSEDVDWRKPEIKKKYSAIKLPKDIRIKLLKLNEYFGLIYSAIDLILKPNNEYVFLEVNPVGEWVWLEKELGINISRAIINELL